MTSIHASPQTPKPTRDVWERLDYVWYVAGYLLIFLTTLGTFKAMARPPGLLPTLWWVLAFSVWFGLLPVLKPNRAQLTKTYVLMVYLLVGMALFYQLCQFHMFFMLLLFVLYPRIFAILPLGYALATSTILTVLWVVIRNGGRFTALWDDLLLASIFSIGGWTLAIWIHAVVRQSTQRRELLETLEATRAELARAERHAGTLDERQRLARELHDTVAQGFTGIVVHLEAAEAALSKDPGTVASHLDQARSSARKSLNDAREAVWNLRPDLDDGQPWPQVLQQLLTDWSDAVGMKTHFSVTGRVKLLTLPTQTVLQNLTREALNNIQKHASAKRVDMTLSYFEDSVALDIQDNGTGLPPGDNGTGLPPGDNGTGLPSRGNGTGLPSRGNGTGLPKDASVHPPEQNGFGLKSMEDQVLQVGGRFTLESFPNEGTTVAVSLPLAAGNSESLPEDNP